MRSPSTSLSSHHNVTPIGEVLDHFCNGTYAHFEGIRDLLQSALCFASLHTTKPSKHNSLLHGLTNHFVSSSFEQFSSIKLLLHTFELFLSALLIFVHEELL